MKYTVVALMLALLVLAGCNSDLQSTQSTKKWPIREYVDKEVIYSPAKSLLLGYSVSPIEYHRGSTETSRLYREDILKDSPTYFTEKRNTMVDVINGKFIKDEWSFEVRCRKQAMGDFNSLDVQLVTAEQAFAPFQEPEKEAEVVHFGGGLWMIADTFPTRPIYLSNTSGSRDSCVSR